MLLFSSCPLCRIPSFSVEYWLYLFAEVFHLSVFKRLLVLLLCLIFPCSALGENPEAYLPQLDILSQYDSRLEDAAYVYCGKTFWQNGCLPASVTNALMAAMGTPSTDGPDLLLDVLNLGSPYAEGKRTPLEPNRLYYMTKTQRDNRYPTINSLLAGMAAVEKSESLLNAQAVAAQASLHGQASFTLIGKMTLKTHWDAFARLLHALNDAGYGRMRVAVGGLGAGTPGTRAPFRSEHGYGHYVALFLQVDEFCSTGTVYLLDSSPRALADEPIGENAAYRYRYDFTEEKYQQELAHFNDVYSVARISSTVLRISLKPDARQALAQAAPGEVAALQAKQLTPLQLYGTGFLFLTNP